MKTVAVIVQEGFAPFEFGLACEAFGLDRSDDGIPNFDFRIVARRAGRGEVEARRSRSTSSTTSRSPTRPISSSSRRSRAGRGAHVDARVPDVVRHAVDRDAWVLSVCSGSFVIAASGVLDGRTATTHWMYADTMAADVPVDRGRPRRALRAGRPHHHERRHRRGPRRVPAPAAPGARRRDDQQDRPAHGRAAAARRRSGAVHRPPAARGRSRSRSRR